MSADYSVGLLAYNGRAFLDTCLASVLAQEPPPAEVVVVDNGSSDGSADFVAAAYPQVRLIRNSENIGVAAGYNQAAAALSSPVIVLLNQDLRLLPGCLAALADTFDAPDVAVVGAKLLYADERTVQHAGAYLQWPLFLGQHYGYGEPDGAAWDAELSSGSQPPLDYVTGAVFAARKSVWDELGGFDDLFSPAYFEEVDFCWRVKSRGGRIVYQPRARAIHFETTTLGKGGRRYLELYHRNRLRLALKDASLEHLLTYFARREARRTAGLRVSGDEQAAVELDAVRQAYADADANLEVIAARRGDAPLPPGTLWAMRDLLAALQEIANGEGGPEAWRHIVLPAPTTLAARDIAVAAGVVAPPSRSTTAASEPDAPVGLRFPSPDMAFVHAEPNQSDVPLVGPLIAFARRAWVRVTMRWYVQPLVDQQNRFNAATAESLRMVGAAMTGLAKEAEALRTDADALRFDLDAAMVKDDAAPPTCSRAPTRLVRVSLPWSAR